MDVNNLRFRLKAQNCNRKYLLTCSIMCDLRLLPRCCSDLRSCFMLRGVGWWSEDCSSLKIPYVPCSETSAANFQDKLREIPEGVKASSYKIGSC